MAVQQLSGIEMACVVDPLADPRWAKLTRTAQNATIFHDPLWLSLVRDCYRYPMSAVCLTDSDGELAAGLPIATVRSPFTGTRLVSVPFSDISGPVLASPELEEPLLAAVAAERSRLNLRLEVHAEVPLLAHSAPSEQFFHHVVTIDSDFDSLARARVKSSKRRCAAKARKLGVSATQRRDAAAIDAFFGLHVLTRRRLGVPTQPKRLFSGLLPIFEHDRGFVLLIEWEGQPIGAGVYLRHGSTLTYKYGASDPKHLDKRPNDLLQLEALRIACELGCTKLDLGRTELDNDGLRRFKRDFGAEERVLTYTMSPPPVKQKSVRSVSRTQQALIQRMPPSFGRLVGAAVYRHFG
jgi:CelD/BcsL family acetyltransferase involved in cellulose biosynthesis